jgi:hypothetical protein
MPIEPFLLSSVVISYALHIGHIGYTIYQNSRTIETNVAVTEKTAAVATSAGNIKSDIEEINKEIKHTVDIMRSYETPPLNVTPSNKLHDDNDHKIYDDDEYIHYASEAKKKVFPSSSSSSSSSSVINADHTNNECL